MACCGGGFFVGIGVLLFLVSISITATGRQAMNNIGRGIHL
jgi:hypothetical protein